MFIRELNRRKNTIRFVQNNSLPLPLPAQKSHKYSFEYLRELCRRVESRAGKAQ